jgi:hypothetical protein
MRRLAHCPLDGNGQQGEAVDFEDEVTLVLTFEAKQDNRAPVVRLRCGETA